MRRRSLPLLVLAAVALAAAIAACSPSSRDSCGDGGCPTPTPRSIPPVEYFSPVDGAAGVPTNAAIIFSRYSRYTPVEVLIAANGATEVLASGADHYMGVVDVFHFDSALRPSTSYHVRLRGTGTNSSTFAAISFITGTRGETCTPIIPDPPALTVGKYFPAITNPPLPAEYAVNLSWPVATEPSRSTFVYEVVASNGSGSIAVFADSLSDGDSLGLMGTGTMAFAIAGSTLNVTVNAFDQAGNMGSASTTVAVPSGPSSGGSACSVDPAPRGWLGCVFAGVLALAAVRVRKNR